MVGSNPYIKEEHDLLVLFSGGADSVLLIEFAIYTGKAPYCVLVDYGQKHIEELEFAVKFCKKRKLEYQVVRVENLGVESKLTQGEGFSYEGVSEWYVPSRNLIFIALAASIAESKGIEKIWYGADFSDRLGLFPDCYQEWIVKLNELLAINSSRKVTVEAPLLGFTKEFVLNFLEGSNIDRTEFFSGYGDIS